MTLFPLSLFPPSSPLSIHPSIHQNLQPFIRIQHLNPLTFLILQPPKFFFQLLHFKRRLLWKTGKSNRQCSSKRTCNYKQLQPDLETWILGEEMQAAKGGHDEMREEEDGHGDEESPGEGGLEDDGLTRVEGEAVGVVEGVDEGGAVGVCVCTKPDVSFSFFSFSFSFHLPFPLFPFSLSRSL